VLCVSDSLTPGHTEPRIAGLFKVLASSFESSFESSFGRKAVRAEREMAERVKAKHAFCEDAGDTEKFVVRWDVCRIV
jgi:hypothetical protein